MCVVRGIRHITNRYMLTFAVVRDPENGTDIMLPALASVHPNVVGAVVFLAFLVILQRLSTFDGAKYRSHRKKQNFCQSLDDQS